MKTTFIKTLICLALFCLPLMAQAQETVKTRVGSVNGKKAQVLKRPLHNVSCRSSYGSCVVIIITSHIYFYNRDCYKLNIKIPFL
jgi:hypothetical protein